jgi:hypothetical protein
MLKPSQSFRQSVSQSVCAVLQEGDLKYMVAFSSARAALEWCLMVQEAALYLNWPHGLGKIPQVQWLFIPVLSLV